MCNIIDLYIKAMGFSLNCMYLVYYYMTLNGHFSADRK